MWTWLWKCLSPLHPSRSGFLIVSYLHKILQWSMSSTVINPGGRGSWKPQSGETSFMKVTHPGSKLQCHRNSTVRAWKVFNSLIFCKAWFQSPMEKCYDFYFTPQNAERFANPHTHLDQYILEIPLPSLNNQYQSQSLFHWHDRDWWLGSPAQPAKAHLPSMQPLWQYPHMHTLKFSPIAFWLIKYPLHGYESQQEGPQTFHLAVQVCYCSISRSDVLLSTAELPAKWLHRSMSVILWTGLQWGLRAVECCFGQFTMCTKQGITFGKDRRPDSQSAKTWRGFAICEQRSLQLTKSSRMAYVAT